FVNPLVYVLLGYLVLHERPRRIQWLAVAIAALGVLWLTVQARQLPWIALVLAGSFGLYGLMRKTASLGALEGLALETLLLAPLRLWWNAAPCRHHASHAPACLHSARCRIVIDARRSGAEPADVRHAGHRARAIAGRRSLGLGRRQPAVRDR